MSNLIEKTEKERVCVSLKAQRKGKMKCKLRNIKQWSKERGGKKLKRTRRRGRVFDRIYESPQWMSVQTVLKHITTAVTHITVLRSASTQTKRRNSSFCESCLALTGILQRGKTQAFKCILKKSLVFMFQQTIVNFC